MIDGLVAELHAIRNFQWEVTWRNYIHDQFGHKKAMSASELRQHHLAMDLSDKSGFVPLDKIREISPRIVMAYAKKSNKTLRRDLNKLKKLELIEEANGGFRAKSDKILAFLPPRCSATPMKTPTDSSTSK